MKNILRTITLVLMMVLAQTASAHTMTTGQATYSLTEGSSIAPVITFTRTVGFADPIDLSIEGNVSALLDANYSLSDTQLTGAETTTTLNYQLNIAAQPILPHQRRVDIVAKSSGTEIARVTVPINVAPVNAPDVYILAGQSNMTGINVGQAGRDPSSGGLDEPNARIFQISRGVSNGGIYNPGNDGDIILAQDPLQDVTGGADSVGLGLTYAKTILPYTTKNIILVPVAETLTSYANSNWRAGVANVSGDGDPAYEAMITRTNAALAATGGILRGVLWQQGEGDVTCAGTDASRYLTEFPNMINGIKHDVAADQRGSRTGMPVLYGTMLSTWIGNDGCKRVIDRTQRSLPNTMSDIRMINMADLTNPNYPPADAIHYGKTALREAGRRYGNALRLTR